MSVALVTVLFLPEVARLDLFRDALYITESSVDISVLNVRHYIEVAAILVQLLFVLVWLAVSQERRLFSLPVVNWIFFYSGYNILTALWSSVPSFTVLRSVEIFSSCFIIVIYFQFGGLRSWSFRLGALCMAFVAVGMLNKISYLLFIKSFIAHIDVWEYLRDNNFATAAGVGIIVVFAHVLCFRQRQLTQILCFAIAFMIFRSATNLIALSAGLIVFVMMDAFLVKRKMYGLSVLLLFVGIILGQMLIAFFTFDYWIAPVVAALFGREMDNVSGMTGRVEMWTLAIELIRENWMGYGFGAGDRFELPAYLEGAGAQWLAPHAHNVVLSALLDGGLLGLLLMSGLVVLWLENARRLPRVYQFLVIGIGIYLLTNGIASTSFAGRFGPSLAIAVALCTAGDRPLRRPATGLRNQVRQQALAGTTRSR